MGRRSGLGKGLGALIPPAPGESESNSSAGAQRIYRSLARASGEGRRPPLLEVRSESDRARGGDPRRVAWYDPASDKIGIDDKVLQMCASMHGRRAEACVALFLGHELAHFYKDHRWGGDFGSRFAGLNVARRIQQRDASPEQMLSSKNADAQSDIWSLGAVLFELLVARVPFTADTLPELVVNCEVAALDIDPHPASCPSWRVGIGWYGRGPPLPRAMARVIGRESARIPLRSRPRPRQRAGPVSTPPVWRRW